VREWTCSSTPARCTSDAAQGTFAASGARDRSLLICREAFADRYLEPVLAGATAHAAGGAQRPSAAAVW
jgi:hypothetical protein